MSDLVADRIQATPTRLGLPHLARTLADLIARGETWPGRRGSWDRSRSTVPGCPALLPGPIATGSTFDGSADLNANADLIVGGMLVDFKAGQGRARSDGTRALFLDRTELNQLLDYALMDYSDTFALHVVAIYATRFGHLTAWPLAKLCTRLAGRPVNLPALRREFAQVLRFELPAYRQA